MKRSFLLLSLLLFSFIACSDSATEEKPDLSELPYYSYLSDSNPVVTITVENFGTMKLQLFPDVAENTVNNFIKYIQSNSYSGSSFHRIIEDFMIQGGMVSNTNCAIKGEFSFNGVMNDLPHYRGVISMARTNIKDSATSQFFIVHKNSFGLNDNYAGFGGLISGFDVLNEIATVTTSNGETPITRVTIQSISIDLNGYVVKDVICSN